MKKTAFYFGAAILAATVNSISEAHAQIRLDVSESLGQRIPIAVPPFATDAYAEAFSRELALVISEDLAFSGLFNIVPETQYAKGFAGFPNDPARIEFETWRSTPAEHLVYAYVATQGEQLVAECRLFDVLTSQQVIGKRLVSEKKWSRLLAHQFADEIVRFLTGVPGAASSEICFSAGESGKKEIYIADYDGGSVTQVTNHGSISIKPKLSPDGKRIAYMSYKDRFPFLYVYDRATGVSTPLSKRSGLNHAPAWSPDGSKIALCLSKDGNTEIYLKNPDGTGEQRLTNNNASDTSPAFSPDGRNIAFVSDRFGSPQIMVMDTGGSNDRRISFQGGNSYDPAWSADGKYIAYVAEKSGEGLEIYVMNADGSNPIRVTNSAGSNESPSWSPDSRHVAFSSSRDGGARVYVVTLGAGEERPIKRLANMRIEGPSWGPRRQ